MPLPPLLEGKLKSCQVRSFTGANPAANTEVSEVVPSGKVWELLAVTITLVQGITQTPQPVLQLADDGTTVLFESFGSSGAQAVSTTCRYSWAPGIAGPSALIGATTQVRAVAPLPVGVPLMPGYRIRTVTVGIGANSDFGAPQLLLAEYEL